MKTENETLEKELTWEELCKMESGTVLKDWFEDNIRCLILRGPSSLCAYLGIPTKHPLAGFEYDDIPLECHGGLTFCGEGGGKDIYRPAGLYWYGWDYSHYKDYAFYYDTIAFEREYNHSDEKKWLVEDVMEDMRSTLYDFKMLCNLAVMLSNKSKIRKFFNNLFQKVKKLLWK